MVLLSVTCQDGNLNCAVLMCDCRADELWTAFHRNSAATLHAR
jgi:hypothetical protein